MFRNVPLPTPMVSTWRVLWSAIHRRQAEKGRNVVDSVRLKYFPGSCLNADVTRHAFVGGLILGVAMVVGVETASAGTCVWIGGGNPNWSTPANWLCSGGITRAPVNGDGLTFPATALTFTSTNDIPKLICKSALVGATEMACE